MEVGEEYVDGLHVSVVGRDADLRKETYKYIVQLECKYNIWRGMPANYPHSEAFLRRVLYALLPDEGVGEGVSA